MRKRQKATKQKTTKEKEKDEFDFTLCYETKSPKQRTDWCKEKSEENEFRKKCDKDFCNFCCNEIVPNTMVSDFSRCANGCNENATLDYDIDFTQCIKPIDKLKSMYNGCSKIYNGTTDPTKIPICQNGFCKLCCVTNSLQQKKDMPAELIKECNKECDQNFQN